MDMDIDMDEPQGWGEPQAYYLPAADPPQPRAVTGVYVVVDTNVLLDHLMVIQKFVSDIERTGWPTFVVIPGVVISELDWQKTTRRNISWSARAASRWILEKLKEQREDKVLRVQASEETLTGTGSSELQPDRNTENDIKIRDCCRFFRETRQEPVYLLSSDVNLSIRGQSDYIQTLQPKRNWSSRVIADSIFGREVSVGFDDYVQSVRPGRPSGETLPAYEKMKIDAANVTEWVPSHALDDLHLQLVDHFTILLKELVLRIDPSVTRSGQGSMSMHAGHLSKSFAEWTSADCVQYLTRLRRLPPSTPRLESFISKPHCREENARGRRRGQDWTRRQWDISIGALAKLGEIWQDQAIEESLETLRIAVDDTFRLQLRPT